MSETIRTPEGDESLWEIVEYIAENNPSAALHWLAEIEAICGLLAAHPGIGRRMQTRRFGESRRHIVGDYFVYYRPIASGVEILFVVRQNRDQSRLL